MDKIIIYRHLHTIHFPADANPTQEAGGSVLREGESNVPALLHPFRWQTREHISTIFYLPHDLNTFRRVGEGRGEKKH